MTEYFEILNKLEILFSENEDLKKRLLAVMKPLPDCPDPPMSKMMQILLASAKKQAGRRTNGERYDDVVFDLGSLLFHVGGLKNYEILCHNLPIPKVSRIRGIIYQHPPVIEGVFRINELKQFLVERNLPLKVHLSEDATVLSPRVQYDPKTNQLVGLVLPFDKDGLPVPASFPATSAHIIAQHFKGKNFYFNFSTEFIDGYSHN